MESSSLKVVVAVRPIPDSAAMASPAGAGSFSSLSSPQNGFKPSVTIVNNNSMVAVEPDTVEIRHCNKRWYSFDGCYAHYPHYHLMPSCVSRDDSISQGAGGGLSGRDCDSVSDGEQLSCILPLEAASDEKVAGRGFVVDNHQQFFYNQVGTAISKQVLKGFHYCVFAHGATSSGKTYIMLGPSRTSKKMSEIRPISTTEDNAERGLIPRLLEETFAVLSARKTATLEEGKDTSPVSAGVYCEGSVPDGAAARGTAPPPLAIPKVQAYSVERSSSIAGGGAADNTPLLDFSVTAQYYEIYNERVYDLFAPVAPQENTLLSELKASVGDTSSTTTPTSARLNDGTQPLRVRLDPVMGPFVEGLTTITITDPQELIAILEECDNVVSDGAFSAAGTALSRTPSAQKRTGGGGSILASGRRPGVRHTAWTKLNERSSRSHAVLTIEFTQILPGCSGERTGFRARDGTSRRRIVSKAHLVDLAGSERLALSGVTYSPSGEPFCTGPYNGAPVTNPKLSSNNTHFKEATKINLSLTTLGRVIDALADRSQGATSGPQGAPVVPPYREATLTYLLMPYLGGNSKTLLIATINPHPAFFEHSLQTLRFASRATQILTVASVNEEEFRGDPSGGKMSRRIRELQAVADRATQEIATLRAQIGVSPASTPRGGGGGARTGTPPQHLPSPCDGAMDEQYQELQEKYRVTRQKLRAAQHEASELHAIRDRQQARVASQSMLKEAERMRSAFISQLEEDHRILSHAAEELLHAACGTRGPALRDMQRRLAASEEKREATEKLLREANLRCEELTDAVADLQRVSDDMAHERAEQGRATTAMKKKHQMSVESLRREVAEVKAAEERKFADLEAVFIKHAKVYHDTVQNLVDMKDEECAALLQRVEIATNGVEERVRAEFEEKYTAAVNQIEELKLLNEKLTFNAAEEVQSLKTTQEKNINEYSEQTVMLRDQVRGLLAQASEFEAKTKRLEAERNEAVHAREEAVVAIESNHKKEIEKLQKEMQCAIERSHMEREAAVKEIVAACDKRIAETTVNVAAECEDEVVAAEEKLRTLKAELQAERERSAEEASLVVKRHQEELTAVKERYNEEIEEIQNTAQVEKATLVAEMQKKIDAAETRLEDFKKESDASISEVRDNHDAQVREILAKHAHELAQLRIKHNDDLERVDCERIASIMSLQTTMDKKVDAQRKEMQLEMNEIKRKQGEGTKQLELRHKAEIERLRVAHEKELEMTRQQCSKSVANHDKTLMEINDRMRAMEEMHEKAMAEREVEFATAAETVKTKHEELQMQLNEKDNQLQSMKSETTKLIEEHNAALEAQQKKFRKELEKTLQEHREALAAQAAESSDAAAEKCESIKKEHASVLSATETEYDRKIKEMQEAHAEELRKTQEALQNGLQQQHAVELEGMRTALSKKHREELTAAETIITNRDAELERLVKKHEADLAAQDKLLRETIAAKEKEKMDALNDNNEKVAIRQRELEENHERNKEQLKREMRKVKRILQQLENERLALADTVKSEKKRRAAAERLANDMEMRSLENEVFSECLSSFTSLGRSGADRLAGMSPVKASSINFANLGFSPARNVTSRDENEENVPPN